MLKVSGGLTNKKTFKAHLDFLIKDKMSFTLKLSNYTSEIICQEMPYMSIKQFSSEMPKITYLAHNKIKKDLLMWSANEMPLINKHNCTYYDISANAKNIKSDKATNFDLSSAYVTLLYTNYFISKETFEFCLKLPKKIRLVCVGMLASNKDIITYQDGKPIIYDKITNPLENYFYWCLDKTSIVMRDIATLLERDFIFSWVDSVYYLPSLTNDFIIENYINSVNLKGKFTPLKNLRINKKDDLIKISFFDTKKEKPMNFNIPLNNNFKKDILYSYGLL